MLFVLVLSVDPLNVHLANICLILVTELVHPADQVVSLVRQVLQLFVQSDFMLPILNFFAAQVFQLRVEVPDSPPSGLMIRLQPLQIVSLAD